MMKATETMTREFVRTVRTCQGVAERETTFPVSNGQIPGMIDPPEIIGARLKAIRLAVDCKTQQEFASEIGVEKNTYNPWETGKRALTFEGALLIRKRYKIPLDFLFFGESQEEIPGRILKKLPRAA